MCVADFLDVGVVADPAGWIITNPPFNLAAAFAHKALEHCGDGGVALLVRIAFLESVKRYRELFLHRPPTHIFQFTERVPMLKGRLDRKASSATAYTWLVWRAGELGLKPPAFHWIAPCQKRLERERDYG